jgi:hypothetical protein
VEWLRVQEADFWVRLLVLAEKSLELATEFPRISFAGNSSRCIKTAVAEEHDYYCSLPALTLGSVLLSQP